MSDEILRCVQQLYKSDIRSMVNFMQSNQDILDMHFHIIDKDVWETLITNIKTTSLDEVVKYVQNLSRTYNMDKKNIITDFLNYIIRNYKTTITSEFLHFVENAIHFQDYKSHLTYSLLRLSGFLADPTSSVSILTWSLRKNSFGGDALNGSKKLYTHSVFLIGLQIGIGIAILLWDVGILLYTHKKFGGGARIKITIETKWT